MTCDKCRKSALALACSTYGKHCLLLLAMHILQPARDDPSERPACLSWLGLQREQLIVSICMYCDVLVAHACRCAVRGDRGGGQGPARGGRRRRRRHLPDELPAEEGEGGQGGHREGGGGRRRGAGDEAGRRDGRQQ